MSTPPSPAPAAPPGFPLYSISETIALTRMSKSWLYGEIRAGRLRTVMVGDRRMIPADALADWLASLPSGTSAVSAIGGHRSTRPPARRSS
jgi:excisionase family DNA binding protein